MATIGLVSRIKKIITKKGDPMLFATIENSLETVQVTVFPRTFQETQHLWQEDKTIFVQGKVDKRRGEISLLANKVVPLSENNLENVKQALMKFNEEVIDFASTDNSDKVNKDIYLSLKSIPAPEMGYQLKKIFDQHLGKQSLYLVIDGKIYPTKTKLKYTQNLKKKIKKLLGKDCLRLGK